MSEHSFIWTETRDVQIEWWFCKISPSVCMGWEGWHENLNENFAKKVVSHNCLHRYDIIQGLGLYNARYPADNTPG